MTADPAAHAARPVEVAAATLACLPDMTPARLRGAARRVAADPIGALAAVRTRAGAGVLCRRRRRRRVRDAPRWPRLAERLGTTAPRTLARSGTRVRGRRADYPIDDGIAGPPEVLLAEGDRPDALDRPRVAVVGTRAATPHGLADARELGRCSREPGVTVVSGLAIGIDGAAHEARSTAAARVVGVVAPASTSCTRAATPRCSPRVREHGLLVSEHGYGTAAAPVRGSRSATGSSPRWPTSWSWSRPPSRRRPHHRRSRARVRARRCSRYPGRAATRRPPAPTS